MLQNRSSGPAGIELLNQTMNELARELGAMDLDDPQERIASKSFHA